MYYVSRVSFDVSPDSSYVGSAPAISSLTLTWNYPNCQLSWFRVVGTCFTPPPVDGCPPFPATGTVPANCPLQTFTITSLVNSGLDSNQNPLSPCSEDQNVTILPSQRPFVVDSDTLPAGFTPSSDLAQYVGLACDGSAPVESSYTFRFYFVCPTNVAPSTLQMFIVLDSPNVLTGIGINGTPTGLDSVSPLVSVSYLLTGSFVAGSNYIDFILEATVGGYMALMVRFVTVQGCVAQGILPPGNNTGCNVNLTTNVLACDAEDVCRILKARGLIFPLNSIKQISSDSLNYNCYTDVTPTLPDCVECCDFLVDENLQDNWGMKCGVYEEYSYTSNFYIKAVPQSKFRIVFKFIPIVDINVRPESTENVKYGLSIPEFKISFNPESMVRRSSWNFPADVFFSLNPTCKYASSVWQFTPEFNFSFSPKSIEIPKTRISDRVAILFCPKSTYKIENYYPSRFKIYVKPKSVSLVYGYRYHSCALISFKPESGSGASRRLYSSRFSMSVRATYSTTWLTPSDLNIPFTPKSKYEISYLFVTKVGISVAPGSKVVKATEWGWVTRPYVSIAPLSTYISSDLGTIATSFLAITEAAESPAVIPSVPAPALTTNLISIALGNCCSAVLQQLQFQHNLGSIPRFSNFLIRNGLTIPGQLVNGVASTFIPLVYSTLQGEWTGSLFLRGLSPVETGQETWNLTIEFGCTTNWRIAIRLFRRSPSSSGVFRLLVNYPATTVCPSATGFQSFAAAISVLNNTSVPTASVVVVSDEQKMAQTIPTSLFIQFMVDSSTNAITLPVNLQQQLSATKNI